MTKHSRCLEQLLTHNTSSWEYYLNIVGSEYPLITNYQLIQKMESVDNDKGFVETGFPTEGVRDRLKYVYRLPESEPHTGKFICIHTCVDMILLTLNCVHNRNQFLGRLLQICPIKNRLPQSSPSFQFDYNVWNQECCNQETLRGFCD